MFDYIFQNSSSAALSRVSTIKFFMMFNVYLLMLTTTLPALENSAPRGLRDACDRLDIVLSNPWIEVDSSTQTLYLHKKNAETGQSSVMKRYVISTAKNGLGQRAGSFQTPVGLHVICKKIGQNCPLYSVFVGRALTKERCRPGEKLGSKDPVTTRILVLDGLEKGLNSGKDKNGNLVDSYKRYIYIHGTPDEDNLGTEVSRGCVRMSGADILILHDLVKEGTMVWIQ